MVAVALVVLSLIRVTELLDLPTQAVAVAVAVAVTESAITELLVVQALLLLDTQVKEIYHGR
jgi:hypothetical protein